MLSKETHFKCNHIGQLEVKGLKKIYHVNINQRQIGVALLISHKIDFRAKKIIRNRETHYLAIKG